LTVLVLPKIYFINFSIGSLLIVSLVLGLLNALVRPVGCYDPAAFRLVWDHYRLVNMVILYLLTILMPDRFSVNSLFLAFVGGLLIGIIGNFLENLLGLTPPILPDEAKELRRQIEAQDLNVIEAWIKERKAARQQLLADEQALAEGEALAGEKAETLTEPDLAPASEEEDKAGQNKPVTLQEGNNESKHTG
jgi:uncharacterized membrane protein YvlD (DUF360 family)